MMVLTAVNRQRNLNSFQLCLRVFLSDAELGIFLQTTRWNRITGALKILHLPDLLLFLLDVTMQYIVLLGREAMELLYSLKCRSVGVNRHKGQSVGDIAGITFLKSREMSGQLYQAMVCRGFDGSYKKENRHTARWQDFVYPAPYAAVLIVWLFMEGVIG